MKKYLVPLLFALSLSMALMPLVVRPGWAAVYSQRVLFGSGAPSGTCPTGKIYLRTSNGYIYGCAAGTWFLAAGGASSPGGSNTQVQYNNSGAFGGSSGITLTATQATLPSPIVTGSATFNGSSSGTMTITASSTGGDLIANNAIQATNGFFKSPSGTNVSLYAPGGGQISFQPSGSAKLVVRASAVVPSSDNDMELGDSTHGYKQLFLSSTLTAAGTTGAQTINKSAGRVNFAASATSLVVTSDKVTASSIVICTVQTNDATLTSVQCVPTAGSFTMYANAAATAETKVGFVILNQ